MARIVLTDELWGQLEPIMKSFGCKSSKNNRNVMEAILWKIRTGAQWREVPVELCPWKTAFNRFNRWAQKGEAKTNKRPFRFQSKVSPAGP